MNKCEQRSNSHRESAKPIGLSCDDSRLTNALEIYLAALDAGKPFPRDQFLAEHAEIRAELEECLEGLEFVRDAAIQARQQPAVPEGVAEQPIVRHGTSLGDFQVLRELGRGGMGIVYEAQQLSLNRRVALKVLPFAGMLDARQLQRFKNEAHAAAMLEHPHIVNVFFVGCERGVHFYAMRYIDGQSLAEVVAAAHPSVADAPPSVSSNHDTLPMAALTTQYAADRRVYYRSVAQLGIQAAKALEYAHQMAIVHRDIKPSNLLLDSQGQLWVTDFGLATVQGNVNLTMTGDIVGTLRYMSPEQAAGKSAILDHRTDIYSLGITLYELLTLQPAFPEQDRQTLLHRILNGEPVPPRKLNLTIPFDLQTIVVKAIAKSPNDRYASAQALTDDLQRFLEQRPIQARPLGRMARTWRWCRRSPAFAGAVTAAVALSLCVALLAVMFAIRESAYRKQAEARTQEAAWQQYVSDMHSAMAAWEQSNVGRTMQLLERHRPANGESDLRGFEWKYLWRQCHDKRLKRTIKETSNVYALDFSHDGRMLATGNAEGLVHVWDPSSGRLIREFKEYPGLTQRVAFSPDDRILASADDHTIQLRDLSDPSRRRTLTGQQGQSVTTASIVFSEDGRRLACSFGDTIHIWDVATGSLLAAIRPEVLQIGGPKEPWIGNRLWTLWADGRARLYDSDTATELRSFDCPELRKARFAGAFSADGKLAALSGRTGVIRIVDLETGTDLRPLGAHETAVRAVAIAPDKRTVASSDTQGQVILWDLEQRARSAVLKGHSGPVLPIKFSYDGQLLCTCSNDTLRIWDLAQRRSVADICENPYNAMIYSIAFSPDSRLIASGGQRKTDGLVMLWDATTGKPLDQIAEHAQIVLSVAFSPDGREVASTGEDGMVKVWDFADQRVRLTIDSSAASKYWVGYSHDNRELITSEAGGMLRFWDCDTGGEIRSVQIGPPHGSWFPCLSPDGRFLLVGVDQSIVLLDYASLKTVRRFPKRLSHVASLVMSPDETAIASCDGSNFVRLSTLDGQEFEVLEHSATVGSMDFSPDGRTLITGDTNNEIHIWDVARRQERATLRGHDAWVEIVRFSPDGQTIASCGGDGTIRLWRSTPPD